MHKIILAKTPAQLQIIEKLAQIIWTEHYTPIIGKNQVTYMLDKFQSTETMQGQITEGYLYYTLFFNAEAVGYFAIQKRKKSLFLSKFYVLKIYRGKGIGKNALAFINEKATLLACEKIALTVNKYNSNSINAYTKLGLKNIGEVVQDIGDGFVMDDYILEKKLN